MKATLPKALPRTKRSPKDVQGINPSADDSALSKLTTDLLHQLLEQSDNPMVHAGLRRAAAEAESLAWLTPVPLLVLPTLLHEKAREARLYVYRQAGLREVTRDWLSLAE
ncbi:MAG: hypothetical protein IT581_09380 [Verrucomicrobiales bacterium]|nr:hypothetical protein [Verrucomicrobiales bacterium]